MQFTSARRPRPTWPARVLAMLMVVLALSSFDWPQWGLNPQHSGNNTSETTITAGNVSTLLRRYRVTLPGTADGAPAYLSAVSTISGTHNLLFVTTTNGYIAAVDSASGAVVWSRPHGPGTCKINNGASTCYTTSSPAVDPNRLYVYSYGLDGYVHKHQVGNGQEISDGVWPELTSLKPWDEKGSSALSIATANSGTSYLYVTHAGYPGDAGDYQGHVTAINLTTGAQNVFNTMCSNQAVHFTLGAIPDCAGGVQSAIWARPGVIYDAATDRIYMATGNGTFDPASHFWGDTVFALHPDGTGSGGNPVDTYTPVNFQALQNADADIGTTAPAILPNTGKYPNLAVQAGKDAVLRLINLDNLSGHGATGFAGGEVFSMTVPQGGAVLTQPAVWVNPGDNSTWVFVADGNGLSGLKVMLDVGGNPSLALQWQIGAGGTSPIVANGVLYYVAGGHIWGLNPVTHATLWHNTQIGGIHWESPIVAEGSLYITDGSNTLSAYSLPLLPLQVRAYLPLVAR